tara:strand:- start:384 stop:1004 length:621 start_codon:yes stop_codon:yes gene_type:complete
MKTIIISGPSGSGKSYLTNKLANLFNNSIIIQTDSYYRDSRIIKILSYFFNDLYDRLISIKYYEIKRTINNIYKKENTINLYNYDFKRKYSYKKRSKLKYKNKQFLILEGIFSHRLDLNYENCINIVCNERKETCLKRRINRDIHDRGRNSNEVLERFNKSWYLYYKNINNYIKNNKVINVSTQDKNSYEQLIFSLEHYIKKKENI